MNGTTGADINGSKGSLVTTKNSLYGRSSYSRVGSNSAITLQNGNCVVLSSYYDLFAGGTTGTNAGAATWMNGDLGTDIFGKLSTPVTTKNSLYGVTSEDKVGDSAIALINGNYVVVSPVWDSPTNFDAEAATCADGDIGAAGPVTTTNSIYGKTTSAGLKMFAIASPTSGIFAVSLSNDNNGRVVVVGIPSPTPQTPTPGPSNRQREKALFAFYESTADSEMGQRWNFWRRADFSKPTIVGYPDRSSIRYLYERQFFPRYQFRGPFKYDND